MAQEIFFPQIPYSRDELVRFVLADIMELMDFENDNPESANYTVPKEFDEYEKYIYAINEDPLPQKVHALFSDSFLQLYLDQYILDVVNIAGEASEDAWDDKIVEMGNMVAQELNFPKNPKKVEDDETKIE